MNTFLAREVMRLVFAVVRGIGAVSGGDPPKVKCTAARLEVQ